MKIAASDPVAEPTTTLDALIREARRRQRRRYLIAGTTLIAIASVAGAVIASAVGDNRVLPPQRHTGPAAFARHTQGPRAAPILAGARTVVVLWPVGRPAFGPDFAPPAYVADLSTGQLSRRPVPAIAGGDYQPYVISVGTRLVYVGSAGTMTIRASLEDQPAVLGPPTPFFAPSATPGRVWLVYYRNYADGGPVRAREVPVGAGPTGPAVLMPARTALVVRGTKVGFLLETRHGLSLSLALWRPGRAPENLPLLPARGDGISDGFDATAGMIAYGTRCDSYTTEPDAGDNGFVACAMLRVLDVRTGRLASFAAPAGTAGWLPAGFGRVSAISPGGQMIAAYAAVPPAEEGRVRLYLVRLGTGRATAVPSAARTFADTAWSENGSWLLYQGAGQHLWAYEVTTGQVRSSSTPCCHYMVMVASGSS
jgi:hypothetical protein